MEFADIKVARRRVIYEWPWPMGTHTDIRAELRTLLRTQESQFFLRVMYRHPYTGYFMTVFSDGLGLSDLRSMAALEPGTPECNAVFVPKDRGMVSYHRVHLSHEERVMPGEALPHLLDFIRRFLAAFAALEAV